MMETKKLKRKIKKLILKITVFIAVAMIYLGLCCIEGNTDWRQILFLEAIGFAWLGIFAKANPQIMYRKAE